MPRYPRIVAPNLFYHVINRGTERRPIYRNSRDYDKFLSYLLKYSKKFDWSIYCYCLMPNHFHLLVQTHYHPLSQIMKSLQTAYSVYFNKKYKRVGPLFSGRFKSIICQDDDYLLHVSKYIHLNPFKAGLCDNTADYKYSSYNLYITENDMTADKKLLDRRVMKRIFRGEITNKSRDSYRFFVEEKNDLFDYDPENSSIDIFGNNKFVTKFRKIER